MRVLFKISSWHKNLMYNLFTIKKLLEVDYIIIVSNIKPFLNNGLKFEEALQIKGPVKTFLNGFCDAWN